MQQMLSTRFGFTAGADGLSVFVKFILSVVA
jgi:hypothetical protein